MTVTCVPQHPRTAASVYCFQQALIPPSICGRRGLFSKRQERSLAARDSKGPGEKASVGDELLDFMYAGRKLRRWYGEDGLVLPRDGGPQSGQGGPEEAEEEEEVARDQILVLDADSPMGEQVVLQLILARAKIKAVVRDGAAASAGFGPYIQAVQGLAGDSRTQRAALRGVRAVVCCGRMEAGLLSAAAAAGVQHLVLLSTVGAPRRGLGALFGGGEQAILGDAGRQHAVLSSGIPCTIVQVGSLLDQPGGVAELALTTGGAPAGEICREDAARVLARVATGEPPAGKSLVLQAQQAQQASSVGEGWEAALDSLMQQQTAA